MALIEAIFYGLDISFFLLIEERNNTIFVVVVQL